MTFVSEIKCKRCARFQFNRTFNFTTLLIKTIETITDVPMVSAKNTITKNYEPSKC